MPEAVKAPYGQRAYYWPTAESQNEMAKHLCEGEFTEIKSIRRNPMPETVRTVVEQ